MQEISILRIILTTFIYGAIDDLYQKKPCFSKIEIIFSMRCIRLSTILIIKEEYTTVYMEISSGEKFRQFRPCSHCTWATTKYNKSVALGEKRASVCFESRDMVHEHHK